MEWLGGGLAVVFTLVSLMFLILVPVGLPGTWLMLGLAALVEFYDGAMLRQADPVTFGWGLLGLCTAIAVGGEILEAGAGAAGTKFGGGSRRGMVGAMLGGILGAILFTPLVPIPLIGTLLGALVGTFAGAFIGEASSEHKRHRDENLRAAFSAAVGRLAGTLGKTALATGVWVLLVRGAFVS